MASNSACTIMNAAVTEDAFLRQVIELARLRHWLIHHCRPARTGKGWATPIQGDAGFPDLVLVREGIHNSGGEARLVFIELKAERGRTTSLQRDWLRPLQDCIIFSQRVHWHRMPEVYLWRPSDWHQIVEVLQ